MIETPLQLEHAETMFLLGQARTSWLGEKALSGFANTEALDSLLDKLNDVKRAMACQGIHDSDVGTYNE